MGAKAARGEPVTTETKQAQTKHETTTCPGCGAAMSSDGCTSCATKQARPVSPGPMQVIQRQTGPQACHATTRRARPPHEAIQGHYIGMIDPTGAREYAIPGGSASGAVGYADLVSLSTGAIYEIKPYIPAEITYGAIQVAGYLAAAQLTCNIGVPWHLGLTYPDTVIPFGDRELVAKQYGHPGLILYYTRRRRRQPQPERVPVPVPERQTEEQREQRPVREINWQNVWDVVVALGLSLATVVIVLAALLDPEPASKLALAGLSVTMIIVILDTFGIDHDLQETA